MRRTAPAALTTAPRARLTKDAWKLLRIHGITAHEAGRTLDPALVALLRSIGPLTEGRAPVAAGRVETAGMTILEAARYLGVDRRRLPKALVIVPFGSPLPPLAPGQVPARRIGNTIRIFRTDLEAASHAAKENHDARNTHPEEAPASPAAGTPLRRSLRELLERRA